MSALTPYVPHTLRPCSRRSARSTPSADSYSQNPNPLSVFVSGSSARFQLQRKQHSRWRELWREGVHWERTCGACNDCTHTVHLALGQPHVVHSLHCLTF